MKIEEILRNIVDICKNNSVSKVILFGSFAKGNNRKTSDIDIAVLGDFDYNKLIEDLDKIETLRTIDLIDLNTINNKELLKEIEEYGKVLYYKI